MHARLLKILPFIAAAIFFSVKTTGQSTCTAVIDANSTEFCVGAGSVTFSNAVAVGQNVEWLFLGDGSFDNRFSQNPTYTPGTKDKANGYAFVFLDVYKDDTVDFCSQLPWVKLNIVSTKATPALQSVCTGTSITSVVLSGGGSGVTYNWTRDNTSAVTGIAASGTGNISGTLTNSTGVPVTVTFTITQTGGTCTGAPIAATVVVSPKPTAVASVTSQSICSGSTIAPIILSGNQVGTTYNWTRNNTSSVTGIAASGSGNITGLLTKTSLLSSTNVTFTITPVFNGCSGTAITSIATVTTSTVAVTGTPASQTVCSGTAITSIIPGGGSASTTYSWTRNNTTSVTGIAASGTGSISGTLINTADTDTYVIFTISRTSSSCTNRASVLVKPAPVVTANTLTQTICSGASINPVVLSSNNNSAVYSWTRDNTGSVTGIAASGSGNIAGTLTNTTNSPVTVTFTATATANGCTGVPVAVTVIVNPVPAVTATPSSQAACSGSSIAAISLSGTVNGAAYNWVRNNTDVVTGIPGNGTGDITGVLTNNSGSPVNVTFTITPVMNGCQGAAIIATAIVNPRPAAVVSGDQVICGTATPTISIGLTGTAPWSFTYSDGTTPVTVNGASNNPYIIGVPAIAHTYMVTALTDANCAAAPADITGSANISLLSYAVTATASANGFITPEGISNVNCGSNQTYNITANAGYNIGDVLVDGISVGAVSTYTFNNITVPHTIAAVFSTGTFNITASAGQGGTINQLGVIDIAAGSSHTFNITANNCYQIADVLVDGVSVGAVTSYTFSNVSAVHTISVAFSPLNYIINAEAGLNGTISSTGASMVSCGGNQTYTIAANNCYQIADVLVDGVSVGAVTTYTFSNVTSTHSISAAFTHLAYNINATAGSNGTLTASGTTSVNCGGNQTYTIAANSCYQITDVLVDGVSVGAVSTYTFNNVTAAHTISATFTQLAYSITATAGSNGTINASGVTSVNCGGNQTYTIAANSCYQITDVLVDGVSVGAVSTYTFSNVAAAHTISATFTQLAYSINATAGSNGTINASGATSVNCGSNQTYTIAANNCYQIADVLVDGVSVGAVSTYTFSNVTAAHSMSATFTQLSYIVSASAAANGTISAAGATSVNCGNNQTYTISANAGFNIQAVLVDGVSQGAISTYTFNNVTAIHTISATFVAVQGCNLTATATATAMACNGTSTTLTVTAAGGTGTRQYSLNGGTFQAANTFTVTAAGSPYIVTVKDAAACVTNTNSVMVAAAPTAVPSTPAGIDGPVYGLCGGGSFTYAVQPVAGATNYTWSGPTGFTVATGQGTTQITMSVPSNFTGSTGIWAVPRNACGSGTGFRLAVNSVISYAASAINGSATVAPNQANVLYSVPNTTGATYNWLVPTGATVTSGQGTNNITVTFAATGGNVSVAVTNACGTGPRTNKAVNILANTVTFAINATAGANGSITPAGSVAVATGNSQAYTIAANSCYQIADVLVDGISVGAVSTYTFSNVTAAHTISATFTQLAYSITATAGSNGTINAVGATSVNCGNNQTYTIAANSCYQIADVLVDGVSVGAVSTFTFSNVTAAHTISAAFTQVAYTITAAAATNGTITPAGAASVNCGSNQTYTITANAGFNIQAVLIDGVSQGAILTYTFNNVTAVHSISATFAPIPGCTLTATATAAAMTCNGTSTILTVTAAGGTGARQFSLNGGAFQSANTFTVTAAGSPYIVTVKDAGTCVTSTNSVIVAPAPTGVPSTPTGIDGPAYGLCGGGSFTYTVQPVAGATNYTWSGPTGFTVATGQGTGQIVMSVPSNFTGSTGIWAVPKNACGSGTGFRLAVNSVLSYAASAINGSATVTPNQANVQYSVPATAGATYNWLVPTGATVTSGQGTNSITVTFGAASGNVSVAVTNACGTGPRTNKAVTFGLARAASFNSSAVSKIAPAVEIVATQTYFNVYPNPAYNNATVAFSSPKAGSKFQVMISNSFGNTVLAKTGVINAGQNLLQLDLGKFTNGIYFVRLMTDDKTQTLKLLKGQ